MEKVTTVYWSVFSNLDLLSRQTMLTNKPESLRKNLSKKVNSKTAKSSYMMCKSYHEFFRNTFVITHPYTNEYNISDGNLGGMWIPRPEDSAFIDSHLVDYDLQWVFFSEDDVEVEFTPAYLHKKESDKYGYTVAGSYNISKWFRPISLSWQLWEKETKMAFIQNDPICYLNFRTANKVVLKQFELTPKLKEISNGCASLKSIIPGLELTELYNKFIRAKRHKIVLKEIQDNLLEL
jgi:hypothetical protein